MCHLRQPDAEHSCTPSAMRKAIAQPFVDPLVVSDNSDWPGKASYHTMLRSIFGLGGTWFYYALRPTGRKTSTQPTPAPTAANRETHLATRNPVAETREPKKVTSFTWAKLPLVFWAVTISHKGRKVSSFSSDSDWTRDEMPHHEGKISCLAGGIAAQTTAGMRAVGDFALLHE